jgi:hypothetical protein
VRYYETDGLSKNRHAGWLARKLLVKLYFKELLLHNASFLIKECLWLCKTRLNLLRAKRGHERGEKGRNHNGGGDLLAGDPSVPLNKRIHDPSE